MNFTNNDQINNMSYSEAVKTLATEITPYTRAVILEKLTSINNRLLLKLENREKINNNQKLNNDNISCFNKQNKINTNNICIPLSRPIPSYVNDRSTRDKDNKKVESVRQNTMYKSHIEQPANFDVDEMLNKLTYNEQENKLNAELEKLTNLKMQLLGSLHKNK